MKKKFISSLLCSMFITNSLSVYATDTNLESEIITEENNITNNENICILNFDSNGGTECSNIQLEFETNTKNDELPIPLKAGHKFLGWFTKDNVEITKTNIYDAFETIISGTTATVYAKWEKQNPINISSSISKEPIENSEDYYELVSSVENFLDGSKITTETKTKKIEDYIIESYSTITYHNIDGTTTYEGIGTYYGYSNYQKDKAKNSFEVTVTDNKGNPIKGVVINFKTNEENIDFITDENGKISHKFNKSLKYTSSIVSIPNGYKLNQEPSKLFLGCMYSVIYTESYILDIVTNNEDITPSTPSNESNNEDITPSTPSNENKQDSSEIHNDNDLNNKITDIKNNTTKDIPVIIKNSEDLEIKTQNKLMETNLEKESNIITIIQDEKSDANVKINEKIIKAPQTSDNNIFIIYLTLFFINILFFLKLMKKK